MFLIAGLGNPDKKYEKTRHNVGFNVIDLLAKEYSIDVSKIKHKALIGEGRVGTEKVILVKPMTYMNLSGESVADICNYYNIDLEDYLNKNPNITEALFINNIQSFNSTFYK